MEEVVVVCKKDDTVVGRVSKARMNAPILDEKKRVIGRVIAVFGPVARPYIKIRIQRKGGRKLYVGGEDRWRKRRRRKSG